LRDRQAQLGSLQTCSVIQVRTVGQSTRAAIFRMGTRGESAYQAGSEHAVPGSSWLFETATLPIVA